MASLKERLCPTPVSDIARIKPDPSIPASRLRIVHAPTDRSIKGTSLILRAVETLKERYDFEFLLVEN